METVSLKYAGYDFKVEVPAKTGFRCLNPFHMYDDLLLSPVKKRELKRLFLKFCDVEGSKLLNDSMKIFKELCANTGKLIFDIVFDKIQIHLQDLPTMQIWATESPAGVLMSDLPAFSFSPQEYISNCVDHVADYILSCIARGTLQTYLDFILKIPHLTSYSKNQLITDIGYLCDVLDDLGLSPSENLQHLLTLLKAAPDNYQKDSQGKPDYLIKSVRMMRKF